MSKAWVAKDGKGVINFPITPITTTQLLALREASSSLPLELGALSPILKDMLAAYEATAVPPVKVSIYFKLGLG